jgi:hypothetical protein
LATGFLNRRCAFAPPDVNQSCALGLAKSLFDSIGQKQTSTNSVAARTSNSARCAVLRAGISRTEICNEERSRPSSVFVHHIDSRSGVGVEGSMSWKMSLEIARNPSSSPLDEKMRRGVTVSKWATIADLMLFDRSSLVEAQSRWETDRIFLDRHPEGGRAIGSCCRSLRRPRPARRLIGSCCQSALARSSASHGGCRAYWRR